MELPDIGSAALFWYHGCEKRNLHKESDEHSIVLPVELCYYILYFCLYAAFVNGRKS